MDSKTLRVSDADRDAAISELGEHFQAGRLDPAELDDRTGRALRARIESDLDQLLADLPRGWHHQWAFGWALWWLIPVMTMRLLWWRRIGGTRPWK